MDGSDNGNLPSSSGKEKAILIHVLKSKKPTAEAQTLEYLELKLPSRDEWRNNPDPKANSWYILEQTANGPRISEIFHNLRQNQFKEDCWLDSTSSAIVGSTLYVIGGQINPHSSSGYRTSRYDRPMSNQVNCLDLNNPADGWKSSSIQFRLANDSTEVVGNLICLIPSHPSMECVDDVYDEETDCQFGLVYDTIEQVAYSFKPPSGCKSNGRPYYLSLEDRGLVLPVLEQESEEERVYLHDPSQNSWEKLHDYSPLTRAMNSYCVNPRAHAVSKGVLYVLDVIWKEARNYQQVMVTTFSAYNLHNGRKLFKKKLPIWGGSHNIRLVPVSDFKLCLLDLINSTLFCTTILVSLDPHTVSVAEERRLTIDASSLLNCLSLDPHHHCLLQNKEKPDANNNKPTVLELYWKRCCRHLLNENRELQVKVQELKRDTRRSPENRHLLVFECEKFESKPRLTKEKSVLIHVSRVANPTEARGCEAYELQFHGVEPNLPKTESWFIIKSTTTGPQISEIFSNVPQVHPNIYCEGSSSAIVGTSLYVIGGRYKSSNFDNCLSNQVRHLDFQNLAKGWEISKLPYCFAGGYAEVADNFIYMLPGWRWTEKNGIGGEASHYPWGLVYDTIKHEANPLKLPQGYENQDTFGFHLMGRGVVVPLGKNEYVKDDVYIHDPCENSWELLDSYFDFERGTMEYVVANDILFLFTVSMMKLTLHAYDYNAKSIDWLESIFKIYLPQNLEFSEFKVIAVAESDFTFCFLGYKDDNNNRGLLSKGPLFYAKVLLSLDPTPTVSILEEACFPMEAMDLLNCLPFDSDLYPSLSEEIPVLNYQNDENPLASSSNEAEATEKELYWKQCFKKLMEDNKRLQKEMQELKIRQVLRANELALRKNAMSNDTDYEEDDTNDEETETDYVPRGWR